MPETLKEVWKDIHSKDSAAPVKYVVTDKGVRVYYVRQNGVDEGGKFDEVKKEQEGKWDNFGVGVSVN